VLKNGSYMFNAMDADTWNNGGIWHRIAFYFEGPSIDQYGGHGTPQGVYHNHVDASGLHDWDSTKHSPIVGFAFDGYPIYGPYAYTNTNGTGAIKRITTSFRLRNVTDRNTLPNGTVNPGPAFSSTYPQGCFLEDWEYVSGTGDLDQCNGRFCITPEYPSGTYAYFTIVDAALEPAFPYFVGTCMYGKVQMNSFGPTGNKHTVPGNATLYQPSTTGMGEVRQNETATVFPNPTAGQVLVLFNQAGSYTLRVVDVQGREVARQQVDGADAVLNISEQPAGIYLLQIQDAATGQSSTLRVVKH
jgi:hypothetical protein